MRARLAAPPRWRAADACRLRAGPRSAEQRTLAVAPSRTQGLQQVARMSQVEQINLARVSRAAAGRGVAQVKQVPLNRWLVSQVAGALRVSLGSAELRVAQGRL